MSRRRVITDMLGKELFEDDVIAYCARYDTLARQTVAVIKRKAHKIVDGRRVARLLVQPVADSVGGRISTRAEWIGLVNVVLLERGSD